MADLKKDQGHIYSAQNSLMTAYVTAEDDAFFISKTELYSDNKVVCQISLLAGPFNGIFHQLIYNRIYVMYRPIKEIVHCSSHKSTVTVSA